jgi:FMN-dependent NADH-azoreductase
MARVFVKTTLANNNLVSVAATHELVEMLVDPAINLVTMRSRSKLVYQYETADPVEDLHFPVNGIPMTNFVYPTYFEEFHKQGSVKFDHLSVLSKPFQIHAGGYQGVLKDGKWIPIHGSPEKKKRFAREDRRGRRSEQRAAKKRVRSK